MTSRPLTEYALAIFTTELSPFDRGGIGVLYANCLLAYGNAHGRILVVYMGDTYLDKKISRDRYPHADIIHWRDLLRNSSHLPRVNFAETSDWHFRAYAAWCCLRRLSDMNVSVANIEFQDFGGLAAVALQARRGHRVYESVPIRIRIHGPEVVLRAFNGAAPWLSSLAVMDLEREAIARCDELILHTAGILQVLDKAFEGCGVTSKIRLEQPPVGLVNGMAGLGDRNPESRVVFASKLHPWKNPLLFLRAWNSSQDSAPPRASALVMAGLDPGSAQSGLMLKELAQGASRGMAWLPGAPVSLRRRMLSTSCVVVTSKFEAFCLLAYEAALSGGRPILNSANPAFGEESAWIHGENCWKFDGTVLDLGRTMKEYLDTPLPFPIQWSHEAVPYWDASASRQKLDVDDVDRVLMRAVPREEEQHGVASVSVVITNAGLDHHLGSCLASVGWQTQLPCEVVVVAQGPVDPSLWQSQEAELVSAGVSVVHLDLTGRVGLGAARNIGLSRSKGEYVTFLDADDVLEPTFIERGGTFLRNDQAIDVYVPFVACFREESEVLVASPTQIIALLGNVYFSRFARNWISSATNLARRAALDGTTFDEDLNLYEDWDFWVRLQQAGKRFATDGAIGVWYRQRPDSMSAMARGSALESASADAIRGKAWSQAGICIPPIVGTELSRIDVGQSDSISITGLDAMAAELKRLASIEEEASQILSRRSVRLAMAIADMRHRRRLKRSSMFSDRHEAPVELEPDRWP